MSQSLETVGEQAEPKASKSIDLRQFLTPIVIQLKQRSPLILKLLGVCACTCIVIFLTLIDPSDEVVTSIDASWMMGLPYLQQQGEVAGRDYSFTYGPLAQWLTTTAVGFHKTQNVINGLTLVKLFFQFCTILSVGVILLLLKPLAWRYSVFIFAVLLALSQANPYWLFRNYLPVICALALAPLLWSQRPLWQRLGLVSAVGVGCGLSQLTTLEVGIYALVGCLGICAIFFALAFSPKLVEKPLLPARQYLFMGLGLLGGFLLVNLLTSLYFTLTSPTYPSFFHYQLTGLEAVRGYNNTLGSPWQPLWTATVLIFMLAIYCIAYVVWNRKNLGVNEFGLLTCFTVMAVLQMKSMIIRSDYGHILGGACALIFLFVVLGFDWLGQNRIKLGWAILFGCLLIVWPFLNWSGPKHIEGLVNGTLSVSRQGEKLVTKTIDPKTLYNPGLAQQINVAKPVLIFPYQNVLGIAMNAKVVAPVLQGYAAHTNKLQKDYTNKLDSYGNDLQIIYGFDYMITHQLDGVQTVTRLPLIFEYIYRNFELTNNQIYSGYAVLQKTTPRPATDMVSTVPELDRTDKLADEGKDLIFKEPHTCVLARLTMKISYPPTSLLGRPARFNFEVLRYGQNKPLVSQSLVAIETGTPFTTYVQLTGGAEFSKVFANAKVPGLTFDRFRIMPQTPSLFDINPSTLEVQKFECINFNRS